MGWRHFAIVTWLAAVMAQAAEALPAAPEGFSWVRLREIRADLLQPAGWKLSRERKGTSETYRLSAPGRGRTNGPAMDINWVPDVPKQAGMAPSQYAAGVADAAAKNHKLVERADGKPGAISRTTFRFEDSGPGREGWTVSYQLIANDRTGSLYIMAFEAPTREWTNAWKTGAVLMERVRLDPAR